MILLTVPPDRVLAAPMTMTATTSSGTPPVRVTPEAFGAAAISFATTETGSGLTATAGLALTAGNQQNMSWARFSRCLNWSHYILICASRLSIAASSSKNFNYNRRYVILPSFYF
ncbi:MAG: hypothetical protein ACFFCW_25245 [Candidatus Hodarchaeota archaeon]